MTDKKQPVNANDVLNAIRQENKSNLGTAPNKPVAVIDGRKNKLKTKDQEEK